MSYKSKGYLMVITAAVLWGLGGIAAQELYKISEIPSLFVVFLRMTAMAAAFVPISVIRKKEDVLEGFKNKKDLITILLFALIGGMYVQYSYYEAIRYSNAATGTVLQYAAPIFVLIAMAFIKRKFPKALEILCVAMAVTGIFLISTHGSLESLAISPKAVFFGITSAMAYAFYSIEPVGFIKKYGSLYLLGFSSLISACILLVSGLVDFYVIQTPQELFCVLFIVIFSTVFTFSLYLAGLARIGSTTAAVLSALEPLVSTVLSVFLFSIAFTKADGIGIFLVMAAVLLLTIYGSKDKKM